MGNRSTALRLSGKGYDNPWEYATVPISGNLRIDGELSFSTWVYRHNAGGDWRNLYDIPNGHLLELDPSGGIRWRAENNNIDFSVTSSSISQDKWHHIAGTMTEKNGKFEANLYVNGVLTDSQTNLSSGVRGGDDDLYLGVLWSQRNGNPDPWAGQIDDFCIWNRGLTAQEVAEVYDGGIQSSDNLILQLTFDDDDAAVFPSSSGRKITDNSINQHNGSLISLTDPLPAAKPIIESPSGGNNIQFSGNKFNEPWEYIEIDKSSSLDIEGEITISSWIYRLNAEGDWRNLYDIPGAHLLEFSPSGGFNWRAENNNIDFNVNGPQIKDGEWAHITARAKKTDSNKFAIDIYLNGEKANSDNNWQLGRPENNSGVRKSEDNLYLGILWSQRNGNPDPWAGAIDDFRIWNSALTDEQIKDVYKSKHVSLKTLVAEFNFDEDTNTTIKDSSGKNNNGKLVGGQLNKHKQSKNRNHILGKLYPDDISGGNNHFAIIDKDNIVKSVSVMTVETALNEGIKYIDTESGEKLVQTSYGGHFRGNYAGTGYKYDPDEDIFITKRTLALPKGLTVQKGKNIDIPIKLDDFTNISAFEFTVGLTPNSFSAANNQPLLSVGSDIINGWDNPLGWSIEANFDQEKGSVKVAGSSAEPLHNGGGSIATLSLTANHDIELGKTELTLSDISLNENQISADGENGSITIQPSTFQITKVRPMASGLALKLSEAPDLNALNIYDGKDENVDTTDLLLKNSNGLPIGNLSLHWEDSTSELFLLQSDSLTGEILTPNTSDQLGNDDYTLFISARNDGLISATSGELIDGNGDGIPGDDYSFTFTKKKSKHLISIGDTARGPSQPLSLNGADTKADISGVPVLISTNTKINEIHGEIIYDHNNYNLVKLINGRQLPEDWELSYEEKKKGKITYKVFGSKEITGTDIELFRFSGLVSGDAEYGSSTLIRASAASDNAPNLPFDSDPSLVVLAYSGDTTGDRSHSSLDSSLVQRVVVNKDSGFDYFDNYAPILLGDTTGNGYLSSLDASYIRRRILGLEVDTYLPIPDTPTL